MEVVAPDLESRGGHIGNVKSPSCWAGIKLYDLESNFVVSALDRNYRPYRTNPRQRIASELPSLSCSTRRAQ